MHFSMDVGTLIFFGLAMVGIIISAWLAREIVDRKWRKQNDRKITPGT
ncbi:MAG: hypothetical protein AAB402_02415 [Patescibacteria group bacterium]